MHTSSHIPILISTHRFERSRPSGIVRSMSEPVSAIASGNASPRTTRRHVMGVASERGSVVLSRAAHMAVDKQNSSTTSHKLQAQVTACTHTNASACPPARTAARTRAQPPTCLFARPRDCPTYAMHTYPLFNTRCTGVTTPVTMVTWARAD